MERSLNFALPHSVSFLIDYGAYALFATVAHLEPWLSYVSARVISSYANYAINRHIVFGGGKKDSILKYYLLVLVVMAAGSAGVSFFTWLGIHSLIAKLMTDIPLFLLNYTIQRKYIFKPRTV